VERTPFLLTLDARSFECLEGEERAAAEYLCRLCAGESVDAIDGLWGWRGKSLVAGILQTQLGPVEDDGRVVRRVGEAKGGFIGEFVSGASSLATQTNRDTIRSTSSTSRRRPSRLLPLAPDLRRRTRR
jgi:hypothetical protein